MRARTCFSRVAVVSAILISSTSFAQGSSVITGTVTDAASGKPVPDVVVTARSPALQGEEIIVTDASGLYRIAPLPAGTYELSLEKESYKPFKRADVVVRVDRTIRVNIQLQPEALTADEIVVVGRPPTVDVGSTSTGVNVGKEFINNIAFIQPNAAGVRSFESLAAVAPQVVADDLGYGFSGAQSPENLYLVDGISVSNAAYGTNQAQFPVEFVDEANVVTGGYQAEFGRATGGILNVVTKSGSNEFHGSVWGNWTPGMLQGTPPDVPNDGTVFLDKTKLWNSIDFGGEVGGPILKDKLWFYVGFAPSFVREQVTRTGRYFLLNPARTDFIRCSAQDVKDNKCTQADYDQGALKTAPIPGLSWSRFDDTRAFSYIAKLTFLINSDNTLSATVLGSPQTDTTPTLFTVYSPRESARRSGFINSTLTNVVSIKYSGSFLDKSLLVDANLGWFHTEHGFQATDGSKLDYELGKGATGTPSVILRRTAPHTLADIEPLSTEQADLCGAQGGEVPGFTPTRRVAVRAQNRFVMSCPITGPGVTYTTGGLGFLGTDVIDRLQGKASVTYMHKLLGHHIWKAGIDVQQERYAITKAYSGGLVLRQEPDNSGYFDYRQYGYLTGPDQMQQQKLVKANPVSMGIGAYLQDEWSIVDLVTLRAGLRYENQQLFNANGALGMTLNNMLAPRIGLIYDFTQQGRSKFFANYARYFESIPMDMADRSLTGENQASFFRVRTGIPGAPGCDPLKGISQTVNECTNRANYPVIASGPYDVNQVTAVTGQGITPVDPAITPQSVSEVVVGGEYEIIPDGRVGVTYTKRWQDETIEDMSVDEASTYFIGNPGKGLGIFFPRATRDYDAVTVSFTKAFSDGWMGQASYSWSYLRGNYNGLYQPDYGGGQLDPNITADFDLISLLGNGNGPLSANRTHFVKAYASKTFSVTGSLEFGLGATYEGRSGAPLSYLGNHPFYGRDIVFILPRGSAGNAPWVHQVNLKGWAGYRISKDNVVSVTADVFNAFNFQAATSIDETFTLSSVLPYIAAPGTDPATELCLAGKERPECNFTDPGAGVRNGFDAQGDRVLPVKNLAGRYLKLSAVNPNFKRPNAFQAPISARFGLKVTF